MADSRDLPEGSAPVPGRTGYWATPSGDIWSTKRREARKLSVSLVCGRRSVAAPGATKVHRLVAAAFLGPCPEALEVNHRDGNKLNDRASNLEYVTHLYNVQHANRLGLSPVGARIGTSRLTAEQVVSIREARGTGLTFKQIGQTHGVTRHAVADIINGESWKKMDILPRPDAEPVATTTEKERT
jgi:hypothetical protein